MTREQRRAYRVLGVPPGSPKDRVKQAYRDLAQVWHPDRFEHSDRLLEKAQKNFARINEAYEALKDLEPGQAARGSRLSMTMSAVLDIGDIMQTREIHRAPSPGRGPVERNRDVVLGVGSFRATGGSRSTRRSRPWLLIIIFGFSTVV